MNEHRRRLLEQEEQTRKQGLKNKRMARMLIAMSLFSFSLCCLVGVMITIDPLSLKEEDKADRSNLPATVSPAVEENDEWMLILVNRDNYLPADFTVDLKELGGVRVDYRIAEQLQKMIDDAAAAGIVLTPCSAYRNVAEQRALYENKCADFRNQGYGEEAARIYANQYLQPPGASEHHTGLAIDFLTTGINELDESFAQSPAYSWLIENAAKYGFVERYPNAKEKETGILWEPWHFRYVGQVNATAMVSMGICLEEFV